MNLFSKMAAIASMLLVSIAWAQVDVSTSTAYKIEGLTEPAMVAGQIVSRSPATHSTPVGFVEVKTDAAMVSVTITDQVTRAAVESIEVGKGLYSWTAPGKVEILAEVIDFDKRIWAKKTLIAELPGGQPKPPGPTPTPTPAPDKLADLHALIIYESAKLPAYPAELRSVINSTDLVMYFRSAIGGRYAVLDQHTTFPAACDSVWCKWLARPPTELPWIILGNKTVQVYSGPLPGTVEEVKALIVKYSPAQGVRR